MNCVQIILSSLFILLLSACTIVQPSQQGTTLSPIELTFLISGDPTDEAAYQDLIEAFGASQREAKGEQEGEAGNQTAAEIQVKLINIPSSGDFRKRLTADFAAGTPPDIFLINFRRLGPYATKGVVEPLTAYLAQSELIDPTAYYPQALAAFTWQGEQICMPQNMSSPVIYYNKTLFDAKGLSYPDPTWDWASFIETARALTEDTDNDGMTDIYGLGTEASIIRLAPFIWMNGGDFLDDPTAPTRLTLDSTASLEALTWFVGLQVKERVLPNAVAEETESTLSRFLNGRLGMIMESRRATPEFRIIQDFTWDVAPLPMRHSHATVLHSDGYCIAAASPHKEAAWAFVEFANTVEGQSLMAQTGRTVPSLRSVAESPLFLDPESQPSHSQVFLDAIPQMRALPQLTTWSDIEGILNTEIENMLMGRISIAEGIRAAEERSAEFFR